MSKIKNICINLGKGIKEIVEEIKKEPVFIPTLQDYVDFVFWFLYDNSTAFYGIEYKTKHHLLFDRILNESYEELNDVQLNLLVQSEYSHAKYHDSTGFAVEVYYRLSASEISNLANLEFIKTRFKEYINLFNADLTLLQLDKDSGYLIFLLAQKRNSSYYLNSTRKSIDINLKDGDF